MTYDIKPKERPWLLNSRLKRNKRVVLHRANNLERCRQYGKQWYANNREKIKEKNRKYNIKNKEKNRQYRINNRKRIKKYYAKNRDKINTRRRNRRVADSLYKLKCNITGRISLSMKYGGYKKTSRTHEILGCDYDFFKHYIQAKFTKGMSWENSGQWHYDHIIPSSYAKTEAELIRLNHYTNFQPLWGKDNLEKNAKILPVQLVLL